MNFENILNNETKGAKVTINNAMLFHKPDNNSSNLTRIYFDCVNNENNKSFSYYYDLEKEKRYFNSRQNEGISSNLTFKEDSYLRDAEYQKLIEILFSSNDLVNDSLASTILKYNLIKLDEELTLRLLDDGHIEIAKFLPENLRNNENIQNRLFEEFKKFDISNDYDLDSLKNDKECLINIISTTDWSKEEKVKTNEFGD